MERRKRDEKSQMEVKFFRDSFAGLKKSSNFASSKSERRSEERGDLEIALWCNGSTQVSGTFSEGSNPSKATKRKS